MGDAQIALRYRMLLDFWYAKMIATVRAGKPFNEPRPTLEDAR